MISDWMTMLNELWSRRPLISELRFAGETRKRSITPRSMSSIIAMPLQPAEKNAVITITPGVRNSM